MTLSTATFDGTGDDVGVAKERRSSGVGGGFGDSPLSNACKNDGMGAGSPDAPPEGIGSCGICTADGADRAGGNSFPTGRLSFPPSDGKTF